MGKILERGRKKNKCVSKDRSGTLAANKLTSTDQGTVETNATSRSATKQDPLAFDVRQVKKQIRRESKLDHNAPIVLSSIQKSSTAQDDSSKQQISLLLQTKVQSRQMPQADQQRNKIHLHLMFDK
ncbi:predicted protein [Chaetoceros tenuissimus]|uniref:Uncharacterized protein n=1 Tax=Chaetoceros tenuissimus TaxID=426638 RepID=A0AAD3HFK4_9STRA|nr:predicted protein [Chaetoceros tenuissimus]